jgi:hypothetical protein
MVRVMEATGEASTPQMARLCSFTAMLSATPLAPGAMVVIPRAEMEVTVPDCMLP